MEILNLVILIIVEYHLNINMSETRNKHFDEAPGCFGVAIVQLHNGKLEGRKAISYGRFFPFYCCGCFLPQNGFSNAYLVSLPTIV
jgi:hypothetical protein